MISRSIDDTKSGGFVDSVEDSLGYIDVLAKWSFILINAGRYILGVLIRLRYQPLMVGTEYCGTDQPWGKSPNILEDGSAGR